jgi:hypothetical protein
MSNPLLLFAAPFHGLSSVERGACGRGVDPIFEEARDFAASTAESEQITLPPGISSMEHWLDLNA